MKFFISLFMTLPLLGFSQKEIPLYDGPIPNSIIPKVPIDTSVTKEGPASSPIDILHGVTKPTLTIFLPDPSNANGCAVIICPGGGYGILATSHEGSDMAKRLNEAGIAAFVLKYRLPLNETMKDKRFGPMQDAQRAIQLVRERTKEWKVNPNRIGILGSSAGGHLASTVGTHFNDAKIENQKGTSLRPDFMILNYPVISFSDQLTHGGSRNNLIGKEKMPDDKLSAKASELGLDENDVIYFSNELQVTSTTPPTFITAPLTDDVVPVGNTLAFIAALQQNKIPVEVFIYEKGPHGYGMKNPQAKEQWIDACIQWLNKNFNQPPMDWPSLNRYQEENKKIGLPKAGENRIVFLGNSITEGWKNFDPSFFEGKPYINRGISGQTTPQMLLRFQQDVIDLKPKVVVILAGINDIAGNTGPTTLDQIMGNIISMTELAKTNGIKVVLSSVTPAFDFPWRPGLEPNIKVFKLNEMIKEFALKAGAVYLDYYSSMADYRRGLKTELGYDGVHPNLAGYKVMEPLAEKAIEDALKKK